MQSTEFQIDRRRRAIGISSIVFIAFGYDGFKEDRGRKNVWHSKKLCYGFENPGKLKPSPRGATC
jgi:hypothetical protein